MQKISEIIKKSKNIEKNYDKKIIRRLKDMKSRYKNTKNINPNKIIYKVYIKEFDKYNAGLTVINPGTINNEYFMTKGHTHKKPSTEIYILKQGTGKLLLQKNKPRLITLKKNKKTTVPKNTAHRLINIGKTKLKVLTIYKKDSGHQYKTKFKKRVIK